MNRRAIPSIAAVAALVFTAASCGNENEEPQPLPETSTTPSEPESPEPTDDPSAWTSDYTKQQVLAFDDALARFETYEKKADPIFAEGKATDDAKQLFQDFFPSPKWMTYWQRLQSYEQVDVKIKGGIEILWSRPTEIAKNGLSVTFQQCVDYTGRVAYQRGEPAKPSGWADGSPLLRTVDMSKPEEYPWLIYDLKEPTEEAHKKCEA